MKDSLVDVSVLMLFFNRPEPLKKVFEQVQRARPARLFLYQDGPRSEADMPGIMACRQVESAIDWDSVHVAAVCPLDDRQVHCALGRCGALTHLLHFLQGDARPLRAR